MPKFFVAYFVLSSLYGCVAIRNAGGSLSSAETQSSVSSKDALIVAINTLASADPAGAQAAIKTLANRRASTIATEQQIVETVLPLLLRLRTDEKALSWVERTQILQITNKFAELYPQDFTVQLATTKALDQLFRPASDDGAAKLPPDTSDLDRIKRARKLVTNFPQYAQAHAYLGAILAPHSEHQLAAMRAFKQCTGLPDAPADCRTSLNTLISNWQKPRCQAYTPDAFSLHAAYEQSAKQRQALKTSIGKIFVATKPDFNGSHIEEIQTVSQGAEATAIANTAQQSSSNTILIALTPLAAGRFSEWTRQLAEQSGYIAVRIGKKFIATPRVVSTIDSGQFTVQVDAPINWSSLCKKFESRRLPSDLNPASTQP